ncbi:L,D-transpeptidase catalytic domain [Thalassovita litoralis]|jgi:L,D-peptidoglycan transpeptidase YkuD (ErfK/YbiS/YcfS/YnhG family)|uniref:L,D-transpeptidase catalytic domain n=1 Tax=Thalassovita litoralis TaxID=1010611 RepID=A0A521APX0_9RHOB|nr:L,D-transpeptidase family protein [Thalassovita litoralis]SMO36816.1 L,D-transpeptidase catalytic domain [Thalassovita litoralis]
MNAADLVLMPTHVRFLNRRFPRSIGRGGIVDAAAKREGDGATPRGVHCVVGMLYRADRITPPNDWARPIGPNDLWSDAPDDPAYNHLVHAPYGPSHETLRRADPMYDLILVTDWNYPDATPGKGSAIFVHQWRRPGWPTAGCVAFRRDHLRFIAERLTPHSRLIIR